MTIKTIATRVVLGLAIILIGAIGWTGYRLWNSWSSIPTVDFDPVEARDYLDTLPPTGDAGADDDVPDPDVFEFQPPTQQSDDEFDAFLAVGNETQFGGSRADVIILFLMPNDGNNPVLVSLPRDLYIENPCTKSPDRINAMLIGCGDEVSGAELLAVAVEDFTGIEVDHFAIFDFDGFENVIDTVGGVQICVSHRTRDTNVGLQDWELAAGCNVWDGFHALGWVRSRNTIQLIDGSWRSVPGVSDLVRNQRQQDILIQMLAKAKRFNTLGRMLDTTRSLANAFTIDDGLSLRDATELAWDMRDLDPASILRLTVPVENFTTSGGAQVLLATSTFTEVLAEAYPSLVAAPAAGIG